MNSLPVALDELVPRIAAAMTATRPPSGRGEMTTAACSPGR